MATKDEFAMALQARKKILRTAIRLKYSLDADYELNDRLGELEKQFAAEAQTGKIGAPSLKELLGEMEDA